MPPHRLNALARSHAVLWIEPDRDMQFRAGAAIQPVVAVEAVEPVTAVRVVTVHAGAVEVVQRGPATPALGDVDALGIALGNLVGIAWNWYALFAGTSRLKLTLKGYRPDPVTIVQLLKIGWPAALTTAERSKLLPDLPSMQEAGIADFDATAWFGLQAPAALFALSALLAVGVLASGLFFFRSTERTFADII